MSEPLIHVTMRVTQPVIDDLHYIKTKYRLKNDAEAVGKAASILKTLGRNMTDRGTRLIIESPSGRDLEVRIPDGR